MKRLILVLILLWPMSLLADWQVGMDAYDQNDYATAYREWLLLAEQGNAAAQFLLGVTYRKGRGVPQDDAEAVKWFRLAAEQGLAIAQYKLAVMYGEGQGVPKDEDEAVRWYILGATAEQDAQKLSGELLKRLKK